MPVEESLRGTTNAYVFVCDCGRGSRQFSGPGLMPDEAARGVREQQWCGEGDRWTCPACRASALRVIRAGSGTTVFLPPDLAEPLRRHFEGRGLKCVLVPSDTGDEDALEFGEGIEPEQVEAVLSEWDVREYVVGPPTSER